MRKCHFSQITAKTAGRLRDARGQALVEFAVVLPVLILIILGIIYFGRYEDYSSQQTQLAGQAARDAAIGYNPASSGTLQTYFAGQAPAELQSASGSVATAVQVLLYPPTGQTCGTATVTCVRACVSAQVRLPFLGSTYWITQTATVHLESGEAASPYVANTTAQVSAANCPQS
jgi:Flp pilus assembly protein TadG